jgi:hypothetical protein
MIGSREVPTLVLGVNQKYWCQLAEQGALKALESERADPTTHH